MLISMKFLTIKSKKFKKNIRNNKGKRSYQLFQP